MTDGKQWRQWQEHNGTDAIFHTFANAQLSIQAAVVAAAKTEGMHSSRGLPIR